MEHSVKNALTVTMATHSFQAAAASRAPVTTILTLQISETVTDILEDVMVACTIQRASVVSGVNRVSMVTLLLGIVLVSSF